MNLLSCPTFSVHFRLECHTFSFNEEFVRGMHDMYVKADKLFNGEIKNYDMLVLPGGRPGG